MRRYWRDGKYWRRPMVCVVEGCGKKTEARWWCRTHYGQWYREIGHKGEPEWGHVYDRSIRSIPRHRPR